MPSYGNDLSLVDEPYFANQAAAISHCGYAFTADIGLSGVENKAILSQTCVDIRADIRL